MKTALVCGGGFIGSRLVERLRHEGYWVPAVDLKFPDFEPLVNDLRATYAWINAQVRSDCQTRKTA